MRILIVGVGVIGTVYGAQLGAAGHIVSVRAHGRRTAAIATAGLCAHDVTDGAGTRSPARVVESTCDGTYDLVLVALRWDQLHSGAVDLDALNGQPLIVCFGNNPEGRAAAPTHRPGTPVSLGFPGVGGTMVGDTAQYVQIAQQPTALDATHDPRLAEIATALRRRRFPVQRVSDMDGWLSFHAVFVACVTAALYRCGTDPLRLALARGELKLMCHAITEGFSALQADSVHGLPRNLRVLHHPLLTPVAIRYWSHMMHTPMGELAFAAHARHAETEMRALAQDVLVRLGRGLATESVTRLLA